jgi:cytochrome c biogenesis factor
VLSVLIFPLQRLLWVGGLIVVAGGLVALGRSVRIRPGTKPTEQAKDAARG